MQIVHVQIVFDNMSISRFLSSSLLLAFLVPTLVFAQAGDTPSSRGTGDTPSSHGTQATPPTGVASIASGIDAASHGTGLQDFCQSGSFQRCVENIVGGVINVVLSLVGILLLGYTMYAGFLWMTSGGETDQAEEAMKMIRQAVIGLFIVIMSFVISSYIITALGNISQGRAAPPPGTLRPTPTPTP